MYDSERTSEHYFSKIVNVIQGLITRKAHTGIFVLKL